MTARSRYIEPYTTVLLFRTLKNESNLDNSGVRLCWELTVVEAWHVCSRVRWAPSAGFVVDHILVLPFV